MPHFNDESNELKESVNLAAEHYENFPVASFLFPKELRKDVALIYRFARTADDIVDEGGDNDETKLVQLNIFRNYFVNALSGNYESDYWKLLHSTIISKNLNSQHFLNLLVAFEQDLRKKEYSTFTELLDYCENSANPVGRIILELYGIKDPKIVKLSDKICSALQLTNFWQDVKIDTLKSRIYIPLEDFNAFSVDKTIIKSEQIDDNLRQIVKFEVDRTEQMFADGSKILQFLPKRLKWQIKWTINGGLIILEKIRKNHYDVLNYKPTLKKFDYIIALLKPMKVNAD